MRNPGPTQSPTKSVQIFFSFPDLTRSRHKLDHSHPSNTMAGNKWSCTFTSPIRLYGRVLKTKSMHYLSSVYLVNQPLHVSRIFVVHHQEVYCIYTTIGKCCTHTVYLLMKSYKYARNMYRKKNVNWMQQRFSLQILLLAQHVSGTTMPIIRSSRVLYSGCCLS